MTTLRVLISCPFVSPWLEAPLPARWEVRPRPSDYRVGRGRALVARVVEVARLVRAARRYDILMVSTSSIETSLLCALRPAIGRCRLVTYDPLQPSHPRINRVATRWLARRIDLALCIRRSDLGVWQHARQAAFVPFLAPAPSPGRLAASAEPVSIHSAGDAHRDYRLLVDAVDGLDVRTTIWTNRPVSVPDGSRVEVGPARSPDEGRRRQHEAGISAILLADTTLPAGPLVLLDAMAAGAAIVCTRSPGLVDYVEHDVEAIVLDHPASAGALRAHLRDLVDDRALRERLGSAARARLAGSLRAEATIAQCQSLLEDVASEGRRRRRRRDRRPGGLNAKAG